MKKLITAKLLVVFLIICVLLSVNACGTKESSEPTPTQETEESKPEEANSEQSKYGGVLRTIETVEGSMPIGVPWEARGADTVLMKPVLENLIREHVDGTLHPWLATGWEVSEDKKAITFFIREGVKFHDGTDLNAEAVKWNLDKQIESSSLGMAE